MELSRSLSPGNISIDPLYFPSFHLEVIAEVVVAKADSAVVTFPEDAVLPLFAEHPLFWSQRHVVTALLVISAPTATP